MYLKNNCLYYDMVDNTVDLDFRDFMKENIKKIGAKWNWRGKCWQLPSFAIKQIRKVIDEYCENFVNLEEYTEEDMRKEYKELFG